MLERIKLALQLSSSDFDTELTSYITEAKKDMSFANITNDSESDEMIAKGIILYACWMFESLHGSNDRADSLRKLYADLKKTLGMATGYTDWT